jgi:hypothetical protein
VRLGSGLFSFSYHLQEQVIVVSDPPVLAGFDPDNASVGESWARAVELETTTISWEDGEISNRTTDVKNLNYTLSVLASESVETPSGTYSALKVKVSDDAGNCDFYWWSSDVDNFVKHEVYKAGLATPTMTLVLTDHGSEASTDWTMYLIVGVVIFVAAAAILAVIVLRGRSFDK